MKKALIMGILIFICAFAAAVLIVNNYSPTDTISLPPKSIAEKSNLIRLFSPLPNQTITSPVTLTGEARGNWFFEASFPVFLTDWDGRIISQGIATAKSDWMTTEFVPFEATLTFTVDKNVYSNRGTLILKKDNPSGLPEYDDALEIPVLIEGTSNVACTMEAKICSDGTAVGRSGPNCEFSKCPYEN